LLFSALSDIDFYVPGISPLAYLLTYLLV